MGVRIARYQIREEAGRGAFTRVLRAWDPMEKRLVALKVPAEASEKALFVQVQGEAAVLFRLRHPNIVGIYEWGEDEGTPFIAVEHLAGKTLQRIIDSREPLPLEQKLSIMAQVAGALQAVHENGGAHLDIRPINIMVLPDGAAKILDFGSVQLTEESAARLAREGYLKASLLYAAPEQLTPSATAVESQADIFTCGVIFYELLTGRNPFQAADEREIVARILNENPAGVRTLAPECPKALARVVHRALQKDPRLRYQRVADLQAELEPILAELRPEAGRPATPQVPPAGGLQVRVQARRWKRPVALALPAVLLVAAGGVVLPKFTHREPAPTVAAAPASVTPAAPAPQPAEAPPPSVAVESRPPAATLATTPIEIPADRVTAAPQHLDPLVLPEPTQRVAKAAIVEDLPPPAAARLGPPAPLAGALAPVTAGPISAPAPPPAPPPPERIRVGGNFEQAKLISSPPPVLPSLARERHIYGVVKLEATVGKDGSVQEVSVVSGHPFLNAAARQAALRWKYKPAMLDGDPIEIKVPIQIVFQTGP